MVATEFLNNLYEILNKYRYMEFYFITQKVIVAFDINCIFVCFLTGNPHECKAECHEGLCPLCELTTLVRCRCGHMDQELPCVQVTTRADDARCQKKCTKVSNINSKV